MQKRVGRTLQAEGKARTGAQDMKALGLLGGEGTTGGGWKTGSAGEGSGGKRRG